MSENCQASNGRLPLGDRRGGSGKCSRKATYTDGRYYRCTQHAKNPPTLLRKADGKIMPGWRKINPTPNTGEADD